MVQLQSSMLQWNLLVYTWINRPQLFIFLHLNLFFNIFLNSAGYYRSWCCILYILSKLKHQTLFDITASCNRTAAIKFSENICLYLELSLVILLIFVLPIINISTALIYFSACHYLFIKKREKFRYSFATTRLSSVYCFINVHIQ